MKDNITPTPSNISKKDIYSLGAKIADQLGYHPNGDIENAITKAGGKIEYRDFSFDDNDSGSVIINDLYNFIIYLSIFTGVKRDRFTIAHELGHYVLHYFVRKRNDPGFSGRMVCERAGTGRLEWEANWFAAGFLMPEEEFRRIYKEESGESWFIADHFGVSVSAAKIRAKELGLNDDD